MPEVRLIDANALHAKICEDSENNYGASVNIAQVLLYIETAHTIEFEPGQWIDKNALIDELDLMIARAFEDDTEVKYGQVRELVLQQKAIDTMPRAQWISCGRDSAYNSYIKCSHCDHEVVMYADSIKAPPKYCEECGFRMDRGANNDT